MMKLKTTIILLTMLLSVSLVAQDTYVRSAVIPVPGIEAGGFGNVVAGVDFDGDGNLEIYAVNNNWGDSPQEVIPRLYKYEFNGTTWDSVWSTVLDIPLQNTWPTLNKADLDNDGKMELVWGVPNNFGGGTNSTPSRFVIYEYPGDGSDNMGVSDGAGGWLPNARWDFNLPADTEMRAVSAIVGDFDKDGVTEVAFADRRAKFSLAMFSVSDVPDNGDGSETWTQEFDGNTAQTGFVRNGVIDSPDGGFGNVVAGMDYDGDGLIEMYAVNNDWNDDGDELIPTLYKYEYVAGGWVKQWQTIVSYIPQQNTWPVLVAGDWDGDGKGEVIWTPTNNLDATNNPNPDRILVYETPGDGSDAMGVDNGDGTWAPNAAWNMGVPDMTEMRPQSGVLTDVDGDGALEFVFAERKDYYNWGVVSVDNIPDNGDGSETWTMEANGVGAGGGSSVYRDVLVDGSAIYVFDWNGDVTHIHATGTSYDTVKTQNIGSSWVFRSANVVDLDKDGTTEFVVGDYGGGGSHSVWVLQKDADSLIASKVADFTAYAANRITTVRVGDIDGDSFADFIVGFRGTDEVYRVAYQGGDVADSANYVISLLDSGVTGGTGIGQVDVAALADIDGDGADEVFYAGPPRSIDSNLLDMVVGDYGDWTIGSSLYDIVQVDSSTIVGVNLNGDIFPISYNGTSWDIGHAQSGLNSQNGDFLSSVSYDVDGDGVNEIFYGEYWGTGQVYMLKQMNGAYVSYNIADLSLLGASRITGGAAGDIDGDGNVDLVFGTRSSTPNNSVYRVKYTGGDITDMTSWKAELIDSEILTSGGQIDDIHLANMDDDANLEIVYTGIPRSGGLLPIVVLDVQTIEAEPIADVRIDSDGDGVPDRIGEDVTIKGIVTSNSFSSSSILIAVQDESAGIVIYQGGNDSTSFAIGSLVLVSGSVSQYKGLTEISVENIIPLGLGTVPDPIVLTIEEYSSDFEAYEGSLIKINALTKTENSVWPDSGSSGSYYLTDGYKSFKLYLDRDVNISDSPEPTFPVNVTGIAAQYSSSTPPFDGYQLWPRFYEDFEQDVAAPPSPYFFFTDDTKALDGGSIDITDAATDYIFAWHPAVDLNGDDLIYQFVVWNEADGNILSQDMSDNNGVDTITTVSAQDMIDAIAALSPDSSLTVGITIRTTPPTSPGDGIIPSVDTIRVTIVDHVTAVNDRNLIPKEFFVDQNYPNPFNPTTTIQFGLPSDSRVSLIIYDILGRVVTTLIDNQTMAAGVYQRQFDASRLASGTYIYRLQADQKVEVKKMLLLK